MVDFSVVESDELDRNCVTRGGNVDIKSRERAIQEQRELNTLMVIYTMPSDIPSTPREPPELFEGETVPEQLFGAPSEETKVRVFKMGQPISPANSPTDSRSPILWCTDSSIPPS